MADRTIKPDSGNDLVLQNNGGGTKIEIPNSGDITITGTIGSGTFDGTIGDSATFPNEMLVAHHDFSTPLSETVTVDGDKYTSTIKIDLTGVTSGNSLLVCVNGQVAHNTSAGSSDYATLYLSSDEADSGIGATTSGKTIINEFGRYSLDWFNVPVSRSVLVQNVTNTAPTYKIYIDKVGSTSWTLYLTNWLFYVLEFKG